MEAADTLCASLFRWLENREKCAGELEKLTQKLEDVHQGSYIAQKIRSVLSKSSQLGAFPWLASKLLLHAASTVESTEVSPTSTAIDAGVSSSTSNETSELIKEDEEVGTDIQKQLRDLKDRCGGSLLGTHADELDCEMATLLMSALARRSNTPVPLDLLRGFNRATSFHMTPGGLAPAEATRFIYQALRLDHSPEITRSLKVSAKEMVKNIELIGIKASKEAGSRGVIGLGISLWKLIGECAKMVKDNQVTEASEFLRDSAREILEGQQRLKEQLDAMHEIIQKLFRMKRIIENMGGYYLIMDENVHRIMVCIIGNCRDTVLSWLERLTHQIEFNPNEFVNLLRFSLEWLGPILEDLTSSGGGHIDIVFVAHGRIVDQFMPASVLVPTPNITDTILYSPWNCGIDLSAAYAIAEGFIKESDREFYNNRSTPYFQPIPPIDRWNSMRRSRHDIPGILLAPLTPEEEAWALFHQLWQNRGVERQGRVIVPYVVPQHPVNAFGEIPLYMLVFAASILLMPFNKTATVHLAASLGQPENGPAWPVQWRTQYAYTSDGTWMSVDLGNRNVDSELYRALKSLFDTNHT